MKNAVPALRFRFSHVEDALKLLVESCRNAADCVTPTLIVPYAADVSTENSLTFATTSVCRRTSNQIFASTYTYIIPDKAKLIAQVETVLNQWND